MILDLILIAIILIFAFIGAKKGFLDTVLRLVNKIVALIVAVMFAKPFAVFLANTPLADIAKSITSSLDNIYIAIISESLDLATVLQSWILIAFSFILLYILTYIVIKILRKFAEAITSLPVLKQINSLAGFAFGVCESLIIIFIIFAILPLFDSMSLFDTFFTQLNNSYLSQYLYNNNFLVNLLFSSDKTSVTDALTAVVG